jgi:hypothetical protein
MRPDHTDFVAHFTKGPQAYDNLVSILTEQRIKAGILPWINSPGVCFTECPWWSLIAHADRYSAYGIGFTKSHVFAAGGGPVYYVRADHWGKQSWEPHVKSFVTPFWPGYRPELLRGNEFINGRTVDYSHEREWRVPHEFAFDRKYVPFVILNTYEDMAKFPGQIKDDIGRQNFILMDMYRRIEELWPTHQI